MTTPKPLCGSQQTVGNSSRDFLDGSDGKVSVWNAEDLGSIPRSGRSPGEGNGNPLQDSCLGNSMDRGALWATVRGAARVRHDWSYLASMESRKMVLMSLFAGHRWRRTRTKGKEQWPSQETEPDLPLSVWGSPAEAWVGSGLSQWQRISIFSFKKLRSWHLVPSLHGK